MTTDSITLDPPGALTVYRRKAMASDFEVALNETSDDFGADAALDALDEVDRIEEVLSIFRPTSAVSRINLLASEINARVDDELWNWIQTSIRLGKETEGAFDVASAPLWRAWGFADRDGEFPSDDALERALAKSGVRLLRLDDAAQTIAFEEEGVELNFGAIGKGFALDAAAKKMEEKGVCDFLIQGGKSGVVACGRRLNDFRPNPSDSAPVQAENDEEIDEESGLPKRTAKVDVDALTPKIFRRDEAFIAAKERENREEGWTIGLAHPLAPEKRLGQIWLRDQALATSGSTYQFFRSGGKRYSHIIDPRTGRPSVGVLSTTVLASTATESDALSTAFFVMGVEKIEEFCDKRKDVGAIVVIERPTSPGYEIKTFNLDGNVFVQNK